MTATILFSIFNTAILPAWLLLVFAPHWMWTKKLVRSGAYSFIFALGYTILIIIFIGEGEGSYSSLAGVQQLFDHPYLLLAGWIHYLVFDLLVGAWIVKDAKENQIHHGWTVPSLLLTFMFGPLGWASYIVLRKIKT